MYADDTVLYETHPDHSVCYTLSQDAVDRLSKWCVNNKLTINVDKTMHMLIPRKIGQNEVRDKNHILIDGKKLHNTRIYKYLGVDMDNTLSSDCMVDNAYNKANRKLYTLKHIRPYITNNVASLIYKACIRPLMEYADFFIDSCNKVKTGKLDRIQKRAVKIIDQSVHKDNTYKELLVIYGLEELEIRRKRHHLAVMYRHSHIFDNLDNRRSGIELRSNPKIKFKIKTTPLTKIKNGLYHRGVTLWDRLPEGVQKATTKVKFKQGIKNFT